MKAYLQKKTVGFYLTVLAMVLSAAGLLSYSAAENTVSIVYILAGCAIAVGILLVVLTYFAGNRPIFDLFASASAVFMAFALAISFYSQLDAIGYVVAGLYPTDKIKKFAVFAILSLVSVLLCCIASFMNQGKETEEV